MYQLKNAFIASIVLALAACGSAENRQAIAQPSISLTGSADQNAFTFVVTATTAGMDPVSRGSLPIETVMESGTTATVESATLTLNRAGKWDFLITPTTDCESGDRPDPITVNRSIEPGVNAPVPVVFDTDACKLVVIDDQCHATPENGRPDMDSDSLADACDDIDNRPVTDGTTDGDPDDDGIPNDQDECPFDATNTCNDPQGVVQITVVDEGFNPITGATVKLDVNGLSAPISVLTDADGLAVFEGLECGNRITRTISRAGRVTLVKDIEIPCTGNQMYISTVELPVASALASNALYWSLESYFLETGTCVDMTQFLYRTDASGVLSPAPYAGAATYSSTGNAAITVNASTGVVCGGSVGVTADISATDGTSTTPLLRVRTY